jgi:hypothetical protein
MQRGLAQPNDNCDIGSAGGYLRAAASIGSPIPRLAYLIRLKTEKIGM